MNSPKVRLNVPTVTSETFDDEIVIINFESGCYHSVQGSGVDVWKMIGPGATVPAIVSRMTQLYDAGAASLETAVKDFVAQLKEAGLVVLEPCSDGDDPAAPLAAESNGRRPFEPPVLSTFSDMQELLWLDPIHEVDESGWPVAATPEKG